MMTESDSKGTLCASLTDAVLQPNLVAQALRLRRIEFKLMGATFAPGVLEDRDPYDDAGCRYAIVEDSAIDPETNKPYGVVATCRLISREVANKCGRFYSEDEFDIDPITHNARNPCEVGRLCVARSHRNRSMKRVFRIIEQHVREQEVDILFGCGSLKGTDPTEHAAILTLLAERHLAPEHLRARARPERYVEMRRTDLSGADIKSLYLSLPVPINGYVGFGAYVADGAVIDDVFGTTDVCVILETAKVAPWIRNALAHE